MIKLSTSRCASVYPPQLSPTDSLCSSSVTRSVTLPMPWLIFSCWPCVSFLMACRSFSSIFIFLSSSPSRSSTLQVPFRPEEPFEGGLGPEDAGEPGRRAPGTDGDGAPPGNGTGAFPDVLVGLLLPPPPLLLVLLLPPPPAPTDVSVRFKAAGPISACKGKRGNNSVGAKLAERDLKL